MKRSLAVMTSLIVGVVSLALMPAAAQQDDARLNRAPDRAKFHRKGALAIPSSYIVVLKDDADADDFFVTAANGYGLVSEIDLGRLLASAGVGLRYRTAFGPIRVDWGFKLNPRPDESTKRVHLTIGHAF